MIWNLSPVLLSTKSFPFTSMGVTAAAVDARAQTVVNARVYVCSCQSEVLQLATRKFPWTGVILKTWCLSSNSNDRGVVNKQKETENARLKEERGWKKQARIFKRLLSSSQHQGLKKKKYDKDAICFGFGRTEGDKLYMFHCWIDPINKPGFQHGIWNATMPNDFSRNAAT